MDFNDFDDMFNAGGDIDDLGDSDDLVEADDDGGLDFDDDAPIQSGGSSGNSITPEKAKDYKKTGIMLVGISVLVLIIAVVGLRVVRSVKASGGRTQTQTVQNNTTVNNSNTQQAVNNVPSQNVVTYTGQKSDWSLVTLSANDVADSVWIDSQFTITSLSYYGKKSSETGDLQVKAVAQGNISGLVGTYEIELPCDKALKLSLGNSFKVSYQLKDKGVYKLIGDIKY